jgi:hypothetical protein
MDSVAWAVLPMADFDAAQARDPGALGGELMVQARNNGRLLDNFRFSIGGSGLITARFSTKDIFSSELLPDTKLFLQTRPNQIQLRKNLLSSEWLDVWELIRSRDLLAAEGADDEDDTDELLELYDALADKDSYAASLRWAVSVGADQKLELLLQSLPASANTLNNKVQLKG